MGRIAANGAATSGIVSPAEPGCKFLAAEFFQTSQHNLDKKIQNPAQFEHK
jgi:hypothetical protein